MSAIDDRDALAGRFARIVARATARDAAKRKAKAQRKARAPRASGVTKAGKKAEGVARLARLAEIRVELHLETGGTCVVCGLGLPFARMHAHHILSGPERQSEERQDTMAPLHERCHDWTHGKAAPLDQRDALVALLAWCEQTKRNAAAASTRRRIAKIDESRMTR